MVSLRISKLSAFLRKASRLKAVWYKEQGKMSSDACELHYSHNELQDIFEMQSGQTYISETQLEWEMFK